MPPAAAVLLVGDRSDSTGSPVCSRRSRRRFAGCEVLLVAPDVARVREARTLLPETCHLLHAPPAEVPPETFDELRAARTLSLCLADAPVPFVAWDDVVSLAAAWWGGHAHLDRGCDVHLGGPDDLDGPALAALVGELVAEALDPTTFVQRRMRELDLSNT